MRFSLLGAAVSLLSSSTLVAAQTYTNCNPTEKSCPPDPALGKSASYDFTQGGSSEFTTTGTASYDSNGAAFTVAKKGDGPLIQSNWYIMFGRVDFVIKAAPGTGIVSSAVLQSDDLDEIDWEWLGGSNAYVQTNYFGRGQTGSYNRGASHDNPGNHDDFHTYTIEWTSSQIVWQIDGKTVRVLTPSDSNGQFPQSPMMVKVGVWAGGDPGNAQGTIQWAGGVVDYSAGPYTMYLKSLSATDYSTGSSYSYSDKTGTWESIVAEGGQVNGNSAAEPKSTESAPPVTATIDSAPIPFSGTHRETSSFVTPSEWPWIPTATAESSEPTSKSLPSGWTFSGSGQIHPPSAASSTVRSTSASSASLLASSSPSGLETGSKSATSSRLHTTTTPKSTGHSTVTAVTTLATGGTGSSATPSPTNTAHIAPTVGTANSVYKAPIAMGALCVLLGSGLLLF
ncbi:hypothetical protein AWENTII_011609 [Aspergillus wentii]|nr:hypothetical protein MW887_006068 [Aspergillus wentii]